MKHVLVCSYSNRKWILGHWVRKMSECLGVNSRIHWTLVPYSNHPIARQVLLTFRLPKGNFYYFTSPLLFKYQYQKRKTQLQNNSVVLITHINNAYGDLGDLCSILNNCRSIHFMCNADLELFVKNGLIRQKGKVIYGAVDDEVNQQPQIDRQSNTVILISKYGPRKGSQYLLEIAKLIPSWKITVVGSDWEKAPEYPELSELSNLMFSKLELSQRSEILSKAHVFLSLSTLEGGPIPVLDAAKCGAYVIATGTGFVPDLVVDPQVGQVVNFPIDVYKVVEMIKTAPLNESFKANFASKMTWDELTLKYLEDTESEMVN
jgi:glycosyltransferase involved in cell wall biosynthesis